MKVLNDVDINIKYAAALLFVFLIQTLMLRAQTSEAIDSLYAGFYAVDVDDRLVILDELGEHYTNEKNYDSALHLYTRLIIYARRYNSMGFLGRAHRRIAIVYKSLAEYQLALLHLDSAKAIFIEEKDWLQLVETKNIEALTYYTQGDIKKSIDIFFDAKAFLTPEIDSTRAAFNIYNNMSHVYLGLEEYDKAETLLMKALKICEMMNRQDLSLISLLNLSIVIANKNPEEGLEYYYRVIELARTLNDRSHLRMAYNNIAYVHYLEGNYELSIQHADTALKYVSESANERGQDTYPYVRHGLPGIKRV